MAATGEEALWMAGTKRCDVIVLDVMLPGLNGFASRSAPTSGSALEQLPAEVAATEMA